MAHRVFLIGMPGSGKTTIGKLLAKELGIPFMDLDQLIEEHAGKTIASIFFEDGEDRFRQLEAELLRQVIARTESVLLACGGGTPCYYNNIGIMNLTGYTVYLNVKAEEIAARLEKEGKDKRPLLKDFEGPELVEYLDQRLKSRAPYYEKARRIIPVSNMVPEDVIKLMKETL